MCALGGRGYFLDVCLAIIKADDFSPLFGQLLFLCIIFSVANWEEGRQSSMNLTESHPEILLLLDDYGNYMIF
jgi:hypothetical protein